MGLRLLVYDRTCTPGLSNAWAAGQWLYRRRGWLDAGQGVSSWSEALDWLASVRPADPIDEVQFWGHGKWGYALVGDERLSRRSLEAGSPHEPKLAAVRERLHPGSLWWFRTCETYGARTGHEFAQRFTQYLGCRTAGHTFIIHALQSGLHSLVPGQRPSWDANEGLRLGSPEKPRAAHNSTPAAPNTVTLFQSQIPQGW